MFYEISENKNEGYYEVSEKNGKHLLTMHYYGDENTKEIHKIEVLEYGRKLMKSGVVFKLKTIFRQILAHSNLDIIDIRVCAEANQTLGFANKEVVFKNDDLVHGCSFVLSAYPVYMGGSAVIVGTVGSIEDTKDILNDDRLLKTLGLDEDDYCIGIDIVTNLVKPEKLRKTEKMNLF